MDSSSNKVSVEYSDPSGVFPLISSNLLARLPLRNLHWNSASRPLRSIDSLHVELTPDSKRSSQVQSLPASSANPGDAATGGGTSSIEKSREGEAAQGGEPLAQSRAVESGRDATTEPPRRERRHQIPGLRRTPYLKVYLLRCDDSETYKGSSRRLLREWVKEHTPPSQNSASSSTQENHDAFEWLIIHIVVLDAPAADQSRPSASVRSEDGTERSSSSSRWPGRSPPSILDKIRSDFNGTSKSAVDRVAQVQVTRSPSQGPATTNTVHASTINGQGDTKVGEAGWEDLIVKMKSLILASFDLRVRQYEEDIRERDSQRILPGWNFCTFFVLKEGLARGFESVGLIEDALVGYDELAVGLDLVIREQSTAQPGIAHGELFLDYSPELSQQVKQALEERRPLGSNEHGSGDAASETGQRSGHSHVSLGNFLLDTDRKPYRELILGNNISPFEFQCYVFARQVSLLLRLARASALNKASETRRSGEKQPEDLLIIAEVCRRATDFITSAARTIREDINHSSRHDGQIKEMREKNTAKAYDDTIENLIAAWTFSATQQVLRCTSSSVADMRYSESPASKPLSGEASRGGRPQDLAVGAPSVRRDTLPARTSSLSMSTTQVTLISIQEKVSPDGPFGLQMPMLTGHSQNGIEEVAAYRANLCLLGRRALSSVGARHGWRTGWAEMATESLAMDGHLDEVCLDQGEVADAEVLAVGDPDSSSPNLSGLNDETLRAALSSKADFYAQYETMTASALKQYHLGKRPMTAEALMADMAALRFFFEDYEGAVSLFHQMAPFYAERNWSFLETTMLQMHAQCLKKLEKTEEYIHMVLRILAKWVGRRKSSSFRVARPGVGQATLDHYNDYILGNIGSKSYIEDLLMSSKGLQQQISVPMSKYYGQLSVDPYIRHYADKDGFQLQLCLQYLLPESMQAQQVRVRLVSCGEGQQRNIWLAADEAQLMEPGTVKVMVGSKLLFPGAYKVDKVEIIAENINFHHDSLPTSSAYSLPDPVDSVYGEKFQSAFVLVWSKVNALQAQMCLCKSIHLEKPKSVEIKISTGWNNIIKGEILVRAASAGLRLDTADALSVDGSISISEKARPGVVAFGQVPAASDMTIRIPYTVENDLNEINVKVEVSYSTAKGDFIYACNPTISVVLPLGVNVQDIFKERALFSRFTVNAANAIPLRLLGCGLEGSRDFETFSPPLGEAGIDIFSRQPASVLYKISRKEGAGVPQEEHNLQTKLSMRLTYQCLDDEIVTAVESAFSAALKDSPFQDLSRLLVPALLTTLRRRLTVNDLEAIGMLREVDIGTFNHPQWDQTLAGLRPEPREKLVKWLTEWHQKHSPIPLPNTTDTARCRRIAIPVEIPQMHVVHTAELQMHLSTDESSPQPALAALGKVIPATLTLSHTRKWDPSRSAAHDAPIDFYYEIHANPETWLIGGQKRTNYSAKENEQLAFALMLIPQRPGHLLYPGVEIRALAPSPSTERNRQEASKLLPPIGCETDYINRGEALMVLPDMSCVTAGLDNGAPGGGVGGARAVESRTRVEGNGA